LQRSRQWILLIALLLPVPTSRAYTYGMGRLQTPAPLSAQAEVDRLIKEGRQALEQADDARAIQMLRTAADRARQLKDAHRIARALNLLGAAYDDQGQFDQAIVCCTDALESGRRGGTAQDIAGSLNNLGNVYDELGQHARALDLHRRALAIRLKGRDLTDIAASYVNLGNVYQEQGDYARAMVTYRHALELDTRANSSPYDIALDYNNLAVALNALNRFAEALAVQRKALELRLKLGNAQEVAKSYVNLGNVYSRWGRSIARRDLILKALEYQQRALEIKRRRDNPQDVAFSLDNVALCEEQLGRYDLSEAGYAQALTRFESVTAQVGDAGALGNLRETTENFYNRYGRLLWRRGRGMDGLVMVERGRAQGLARQSAQNRLDLAQLFGSDDATRLRQREDALAAASRHRQAIREETANSSGGAASKRRFAEQRQEAERQWQEAERDYTLLRDALYIRYPQYRLVQGPPPPTAAVLNGMARRHPDTLYLCAEQTGPARFHAAAGSAAIGATGRQLADCCGRAATLPYLRRAAGRTPTGTWPLRGAALAGRACRPVAGR
jgi:tetratricopeptide (TPR) repeat protein